MLKQSNIHLKLPASSLPIDFPLSGFLFLQIGAGMRKSCAHAWLKNKWDQAASLFHQHGNDMDSLPPARILCYGWRLSAFNGFSWNVQEMLIMGQKTDDLNWLKQWNKYRNKKNQGRGALIMKQPPMLCNLVFLLSACTILLLLVNLYSFYLCQPGCVFLSVC